MLPLFVYAVQACVYFLYFIINKSARRAYNAAVWYDNFLTREATAQNCDLLFF